MKNTALPRALFVIVLCASTAVGCNPFKWPPKLISERTSHLSLHQPASPTTPPNKPAPPINWAVDSPAEPAPGSAPGR